MKFEVWEHEKDSLWKLNENVAKKIESALKQSLKKVSRSVVKGLVFSEKLREKRFMSGLWV